MSHLLDRWSTSTVGELAASIQYGYTASARSDVDGPRFLRITDIQDGQVDWASVPSCEIERPVLEKYRLHDGDIVFARTGATTGKSYLIKNAPPAVFASYLIRLRMAGGLDPAYLAYFFQTVDYWRQIERGKRGVGQPNINAKTLSRIEVPVAPPDQQSLIVAKLDELFSDCDAGIAALERAQANLKRYRAAVLKAAVEGKLTEQWRAEHPDVEPASALLERILAERRAKWENEQLRKYEAKGKKPPKGWKDRYNPPIGPTTESLPGLPDRWCWATVDQVLLNHDGRRIPIKRKDRDDRSGPYPYYGASGVIDDIDDFLFDGDYLLVAEDGANLLSRSTPIAFRASGRFWVNNHAHVLQTMCGVPLEYPEIVFNATNLQFYITGTAQPKLPQLAMNKIPMPLAPISEQGELVSMVESVFSSADHSAVVLGASIVRATRLRQAILKRAFEGLLIAGDKPGLKSVDEICAKGENLPAHVELELDLR